MDQVIAMPWYKSKVIIGAAVSGIAKLLVLTGVLHELDTGLQTQLVDFVVLGASLIADGVVVHSRATQTQAPTLTATKQQADVLKSVVQAAAPTVVEEVIEKATGVEVPSWMLR